LPRDARTGLRLGHEALRAGDPPRARVPDEGGARDGRRPPRAPDRGGDEGRRRPRGGPHPLLRGPARALLPARARAAGGEPGRHALCRAARGGLPRSCAATTAPRTSSSAATTPASGAGTAPTTPIASSTRSHRASSGSSRCASSTRSGAPSRGRWPRRRRRRPGRTSGVALSGTGLREMLARGERPPEEFTRPEVADVLLASHVREPLRV
jgi:ATP sulfurylase